MTGVFCITVLHTCNKKKGIKEYTRDDGEDPGNTWTPLIKIFPSFSRMVSSLLSCDGGLENFLSSSA